ncbi:cell wall binding repeat-containing protein [Clostridium sp. DL-VIII]|uniref:N-acetylmuramoyl-L-alanine amidase family protein n=1 Tax=Clostridium sp. DL-VIII TaxID=641107 RepID=UPI00023B05BA|nr:N-acetylmuramoyl-L-alanine amidase family protein [Clostridium sp. DL-VIII]EHJ00894.1 cell wall binding repeat-containing protein [Clostridium sp. DL-VIII]
MNKKIRKMITCTLIISALCTISPVTNLLTTKAYASSTHDTKLKDIDLNHGHIDFLSNDDTYLNDLYLSDGYMSFNKDNTSYYVTAFSSVDNTKIRTKLKDEANLSNTSNKINQWVSLDGHMQYIDASGNPLKNTWFWDSNIKKYHFLNGNGYMHTGWLSYNSHWYYLDENGIMLTGWQYLNDNWYYLNYGGEMLTGWFKDNNGRWYFFDNNGTMLTGWIINNGKYYHLSNSGAMDYNQIIDGFRLGSDGAWIGR